MSPSDTPPSGDDPGVLSGLSRTRPQRRSNKRPGRPAPAATDSEPATTPKAKKAAPKKPRATSPAPEQPALEVGRTAEPRAERPTVAAAQGDGGVDLVGQAIAAAGEVAQLGVGLGRQVAKGILSRLPKP